MTTCPRCGDRLNLELDGHKILDAWCDNEACEIREADALTVDEYSFLEADLMGSLADAAMDRMEER